MSAPLRFVARPSLERASVGALGQPALLFLAAAFSIPACSAVPPTAPDAGLPTEVGVDASDDLGPTARLGYAVASFRIHLPHSSADQPGVVSSEGLDLDGSSDAVCGQPDYTTDSGELGVDNAFEALWLRFAAFLVSVNGQGLDAITELLARAPADGGFNFAVFLEDAVDGTPGKRLAVVPLSEPLRTGADAEVLAYQTVPVPRGDLSIRGRATEDGRFVYAEGVGFAFPFATFGFSHAFEVRDARVRVERHDDGRATLTLAFPFRRSQLIALARAYQTYFAYFDAELAQVIEAGMRAQLDAGGMDLEPDEAGACQAVSTQFEADLVPVFVQ